MRAVPMLQWHLQGTDATPWPLDWPQEPLDLRPNARHMLVVAWWQSSVAVLLHLAQLLDVAERAFPPPHFLFSGSLLALCTAAGDALDDQAVFCAIARQWAYLQGYLHPRASSVATAAWDDEMALAFTNAYVPWSHAVLAAWPSDAFPARILTTPPDVWVTETAPAGTGPADELRRLARNRDDRTLAIWLRTALRPLSPPLPAASLSAVVTQLRPGAVEKDAAAALEAYNARMQRLSDVPLSPERRGELSAMQPSPAVAGPPAGKGRGRPTVLPAQSAAAVTGSPGRSKLSAAAAAGAPGPRFSEASMALPIMTFAKEVVERAQSQRLLCIQGETGCGKSSVVPLLLYYDAIDHQRVRAVNKRFQPTAYVD